MPGLVLAAGIAASTALGCSRVTGPRGECQVARLEREALLVSRCPAPEVTLALNCGAGCRQLTRVGNVPTDASLSCLTRRAFWWIGEGHLLRADLAAGRAESLLGPIRAELPITPTGVACDGDDVVFTATMREPGRERIDLVARLRDGGERAQVLWIDRAMRIEQPSPSRPAVRGDTVAWVWDFTVPTLWVMRGRSAPGAVRSDLRTVSPVAIGDHGVLVQAGPRIERWAPGLVATQPLARGEGDQWAPTSWGPLAAWIDQRDELRGTLRTPRNPQVYLLDVRDGRPVRVTSPAVRAWRGDPSLSERWLVWVDTRRDPVPDREPGQWVRAEVYGRHLPTGRELPLARDVIASLPRVANDKVYFVRASEGPRRDLFVVDLPRVSGGAGSAAPP